MRWPAITLWDPWVGSAPADDDAAMDSFALLQEHVLNTKRWETREELRIAMVTCIEQTYCRCRQEALGRLTPRIRDHHDHTVYRSW